MGYITKKVKEMDETYKIGKLFLEWEQRRRLEKAGLNLIHVNDDVDRFEKYIRELL